ncbi:MAG: DPP IV N-terminal domain-containing protein [Planctomycetota bacterium]
MHRCVAFAALALAGLCFVSIAQEAEDAGPIETVAEASGFTRTSTSDEVDDFLGSLAARSDLVRLTSIGETHEGRALSAAIIADPPVEDPDGVGSRSVVLLFGNIHGGEVAGKEALLALSRDLLLDDESELGLLRDEVLRDLVLLVVPNYNADGNDVMSPDNRPRQIGPDEMGIRSNAQGYDLNRDWIKMDAPETRAMVGVLNAWDPIVTVDTHTTNGSLHGHVITYQGPKHPAGDGEVLSYVRDTMLPAVDAAYEERTGEVAFFYGNLTRDKSKWVTYPAEPRYGAAYRGLRNRPSILTEAYAYATYEERVIATYELCTEILRYTADNAGEIVDLVEAADDRTVERGRDPSEDDTIVVRQEAAAFDGTVMIPGYESARLDGPQSSWGETTEYEVEFWNDFVATEEAPLPYAYVFEGEFESIAFMLQRHGIDVEVLREDIELDAVGFEVTGTERAGRVYEQHTMIRSLELRELELSFQGEPGMYVVRTGQPLGTLAGYLLEPRSSDGLVAWNAFDPWIPEEADVWWTYPVVKVMGRQPMLVRGARGLPEDRETGKRLSYENVFGDDRVDLDGSAVFPRWDGPGHYLLRKDDEVRRVDAETGRSEVFDADTSVIEEKLAELPTLTLRDAKRYARRFQNPDPAAPGVVFEHGDDLYYANWDGSGAVRLTSTIEDEELATLSPDGAWVAFVRENDLYVIDRETRTERRLTTGGTDVIRHGKNAWVYFEEIFGRSWKAYWWAPDSRHIAVLMTDSTEVPEFIIVDDKEEPQRVEKTRYPKPGQPNPGVSVGIASVAGGAVRGLDLSDYDKGSFIIGMIAWTQNVADPKLHLGVMNRQQTWLDLTEFSTSGGGGTRMFREQTEAWVDPPADIRPGRRTWNSGSWELGDGTFLWFSERDGWKHIYHYDASGGLVRRVTEGAYEVRTVHRIEEPHGDEAGSIWFTGTVDSSTQEHLYRVSFGEDEDPTQRPERLTREDGSHRVSFAPDGGPFFVDTWSDIETTPKVALRNLNGGLVRMIDENPVFELESFELPEIERVVIESERGVEMEGMLFYPTGFDPERTYPVWFMTYGGPHAPTVTDSFRRGWTSERLLAELGIVVFRADPYPASGKGAESTWTAYERLGEREIEDLRELIAWVTDHPWADASRIGMSGHSYGGYLTAKAMTDTELFSAGISGAPVTSWRDYDTIYTERYMNTPQNNTSGYDGTDVVANAGDLHGRLLLLHGTMDDNVHLQNSIKLIDALRREDKMFDVFFYPGFRHGIRNSHYMRLTHEFMLETMLGDGGGDGAAPDDEDSSGAEEKPAAVMGPAGFDF